MILILLGLIAILLGIVILTIQDPQFLKRNFKNLIFFGGVGAFLLLVVYLIHMGNVDQSNLYSP